MNEANDNGRWFVTLWVGSHSEQVHVGVFATHSAAEKYVEELKKRRPDLLTKHMAPHNYVIDTLHSRGVFE